MDEVSYLILMKGTYMGNFIQIINRLLKRKTGDKSPDKIVQTALEMTGYSPTAEELSLAYTVIQTQIDNNNQFEAYQFE